MKRPKKEDFSYKVIMTFEGATYSVTRYYYKKLSLALEKYVDELEEDRKDPNQST